MIKTENFMIPEHTTHQYSYWPQHQLPMDTQVLTHQLQSNLMDTTTSDLRIRDTTISPIPIGEQLYDNSDYTNITPGANNYMACFQPPSLYDFQAVNNFFTNENRETSVYDIPILPYGVDKVNGSGGNDPSSTSAESTISWGGEINTFECSPVGSIISYDVDYAPRGMCAFEDQQPYLGFYY